MKKGQTSVTDGIQNFLCPFTEMRITQVENVGTHKGTKAIDVAAKKAGTKAAYYAPADCECVWTYPANGESRWLVEKARFANGYIGPAVFEICHDESFNAYVGMKLKQGEQLGNMGAKGGATGVHCHIQIAQTDDTTFFQNKYGIYQFNKEVYCDEAMFIDGTTIVDTGKAKWKYAPKESNSKKCPFKSSGYVEALATVNVRTKPTTKSGDTGKDYKKGMELYYSSIVEADGYYWAKYMSNDGEIHYCALCSKDLKEINWKQK